MVSITNKRIEYGLFLLLFSSFFISFSKNIYCFDMWWHLATGELILKNHIIPKTDPFSYTKFGEPWIDHEWLAQVIFYSIYKKSGMLGLTIFKCLILTLALYLVYLNIRKKCDPLVSLTFTFFSCVLLNCLGIPTRPLIFTLFFLSLTFYLLENEKYSPLFIIFPLWVNFHAGFILGTFILTFYAMRRKEAKLLIPIALCFLNPYTYKIFLYPLQYAKSSVHTAHITEWQSPSFHKLSPFEAFLLASFFIFPFSSPSIFELFLFVIFVHFSLFAVRNIMFFAIIAMPIIAWNFSKMLKKIVEKSDPKINYIANIFIPSFFIGLIIFGSFANFLFVKKMKFNEDEIFPSKACEEVKKLEGNLFNLYAWGGYIIWKLYPEKKVFIDGRADLYQDLVGEYKKVVGVTPEADKILDKYNVTIVLIPTNSSLSVFLKEKEEWGLKYRDDLAEIYVREN